MWFNHKIDCGDIGIIEIRRNLVIYYLIYYTPNSNLN